MLIDHILLTQKEEFSFLGKSDENVEMMARQITELKKHMVTGQKLEEIVANTQDEYLKRKLEDITKLYENYIEKIQSNYIDENDGLTILAQQLEQSNQFQNHDIYIDEFAGFTIQEYEILRKLMKLSHQVTVTICTDNLEENTNPDIDIFYANKQTTKKILEIAKQEQVKVDSPINMQKEQVKTLQEKGNYSIESNKRFKTPELKHLAENSKAPFYTKYENKVENISLFLANNPYSEIEHVAIEIIKLIQKGYRYEEIAVITKNILQYASLCRAIFRQYKIPVFIDEKKDLSNNLIAKFILSLLEIFSQNWSYEAMFGLIKTGLYHLDEQEIALLENYCLKWGIKGNKWYTKDWNFYDETEEEQKQILHAKEQVVQPLLKFKKTLQGLKTVKEITTAIYYFLIENEVDKKILGKLEEIKKQQYNILIDKQKNNQQEINDIEEIEQKIKTETELNSQELQKEYETSLQILIDLLDEIVLVLGDETITFERYAKILKMGLNQTDLGIIPATLDQVIVGDVDRSRSHKVKVAFLIGLNDGSFPTIQKDEGFLDDKDRQILKQKGIELAKGTLEQLYDDNFNIYKAFTTAEEKLYLSYVSSDIEGRSLRPSILVNKIKRIFPNLQEQSDIVNRVSEILLENTTFNELLVQLRDWKEGKQIETIWFQIYEYFKNKEPQKLENAIKSVEYQNIPEKLQKEKIEKLYGNTLKTSVSRLEQYKSCAFSYYLKYVLKIKDKNTFGVQAIDTGNFMHEVIDSFFEKLEEDNLHVKELSEEKIKNITEEIVQEKLTLKKYDIFNSIPKYRLLAQRLKRVIAKSMIYIVDGLKYSDFEVLGHEVELKEGKQLKPIILELKDGKKVELTGKIDRIDIAKTTNGNYIRIIDYKSSIKNIDLDEVIAGVQLQLLTYLDAVCKQEDVMPAATLYFPLIDPIVNGSQDMWDEEIEKEIRKQFKMQGLILADSKIVKKMDSKLVSGSSDIVPAYINKEGEVSQKPNTLNKEQFENLQNYMEKIIKQISEEIFSGNIAIEPYYRVKDKKTPCEYCDYKAICQFNQTSLNKYCYISNTSKEYVLEQIMKI